MATFRLCLGRSSAVHQKCIRTYSTEQAVAASFKPSKFAVRSSQNDPTNHTKEDIGKLYTMPEEVRKKLFAKYILPIHFERFCDTFMETPIVIRSPAMEIIDYMKKADYNRPIIRYVIYGRRGCGKTLTLIHALNYAYNNNFIIVYVPSASQWYHWSREISSAEREEGLIDLPLDAAVWLKHFDMTNSQLIKKLDLKVTRTYEWSQREKTAEGASLNELVSHGINRVKYACQVIDALLNELKVLSSNKSCKTFAAIDGYNAFFQTHSRLKTPDKVPLVPANVSITRSFLSFIKNDWTNGAAVLTVCDRACLQGVFTSHFPFHLLKKSGVEHIDPFIPVNVPEYTPLEFHNYLDYLEEMRWLQKPEGRDEIEFVTQRNPRDINTYCATR